MTFPHPGLPHRSVAVRRFLVMVPHRDIRPALREWQARLFAAGIPGVWSFPPVILLAPLATPLPEQERRALARSLRNLSRRVAGTGTAVPGDRPFFVAKGNPVSLPLSATPASDTLASDIPTSDTLAPVSAGGLLLWGLPITIPAGMDSWPPRWSEPGEGQPRGPAVPPSPGFPWLSPLLLAAFLTGDTPAEEAVVRSIIKTLEPPEIRFRAAALSNLLMWPLDPAEPDPENSGPENPAPESPSGRSVTGISLAWKLGKPTWLPGK